MSQVVFAVLTVSDSCTQDPSKDRSGPRLVQLIGESFENARILTEIIPDEALVIKTKLEQLITSKMGVHVIITTGGTGFGPRDVTPEATKPLLQKECPQLMMAIALASLQKTKFAALSRGLCGICQNTLILNFPGSEKAVIECYDVVKDLLPHALQLMGNELALVKRTHQELQQVASSIDSFHVCPHKTGKADGVDRNSPYPMIEVAAALNIIYDKIQPQKDITKLLEEFRSPVDIPPFRASIKDGYAMKSSGFSGSKKVLGCIAAGDEINTHKLAEDECFKINTGAAVPLDADCVIQIEDTKLLKTKKNGQEDLVEILVEPKANLDIRPIGCDLKKGTLLFPSEDYSNVVIKALLASVGIEHENKCKAKIAIVSTGSELMAPNSEQSIASGSKIYDSNTTMLQQLLNNFGFDCHRKVVLGDEFDTVKQCLEELYSEVDFIICSGGVSMGDKDYVKPVLKDLGFKIEIGRVNMKPGKPMTFASKSQKFFFGLPGNPVSAFVTFHLFALPALRWYSGWQQQKCSLATLNVVLQNDSVPLDARPEFMRASITSKNGQLYASINGNQMSSRLQSIVGADILLHLPSSASGRTCALKGDICVASILRCDFISKYE